MDRPPPHIEQIVPHRSPFRFVDSLVEIDGDTGRFELALLPADTRLCHGTLSPLLLVEALAQSTAAYNAASSPNSAQGKERGVLVEVSKAQLHGPARGGAKVDLEVRKTRQFGQLVRFEGWARQESELLVTVELTVQRHHSGGPNG